MAINTNNNGRKGTNMGSGPRPNMQGPGANYSKDPRSPYYNVYGPGAQNNQNSYNNYAKPNPTGAPVGNANNAQNKGDADKDKKKEKKSKDNGELPARFIVPEGREMTRKEKKIYKKVKKFDDYDLRNYPMTAGKWILTFIIMWIPLVNIIAGICWLFGAGNKSRSAYVRAHLIIFLVIVLIIGIILGVSYSVLKTNAKKAGAETQGEMWYYAVDQALGNFESMIGKDMADALRAQVAAKLGVKGPDIDNGNENDQDD
ncbi:MAG: hypothetical protein K2J13_01690, partial [Clostridia bacterium]|nr:hypothetical protein [Clostridia bacterium]